LPSEKSILELEGLNIINMEGRLDDGEPKEVIHEYK
jgi:hypothetical protein